MNSPHQLLGRVVVQVGGNVGSILQVFFVILFFFLAIIDKCLSVLLMNELLLKGYNY